MKKETRTAVFDDELRVEAYRFEGIIQPFPNHFHEYYVIGFIENGRRSLSCGNQEYMITKGDIVLFHPGDNHACIQSDEGTLDYRGINISKEVMRNLAEEAIGEPKLPCFSKNVISDEEAVCYLRPLHELIMKGSHEFGKEEKLLLLISLLILRYGQSSKDRIPEYREEIEKACDFMEQHFADRISLDQLCRCVGLGKSTLLRAFTRSKGVTPYRYLESVRIGKAKKLLEQGMSPVETAMLTGFSDQSHFTNYFSRFIGLAPGLYHDIFSEKEFAKEETPDE
ncbi:MAG: AraC family transcriptional regulator [Lachnospiraceae bacterium]|nr:AraC family transcriptional regulator [Lachnospiraceae bacterium]